ncbi:tyrosine-type recombinase/integrase [Oceanihabitans sp. IOP_32]|uniref:tyrosine-type recombinase/integrase n=1 Tax=Oceanihabitans sp. IOP_32 TaxID=2529032 RepID=UPI0021082477|nr:tyrosine-type recombinase/integrase [Oceanihabitans sp. IOP_32]
MRVILPSIERPKKLPVVLNQREVKKLLRTPRLLKHRLVLAMLYGCGLRNFELRNLQRRDLDFDRKLLHVRQGKGRKDRYVPLSEIQIRGLKKYLQAENPVTWCFTAMIEQAVRRSFPRKGYSGSCVRPASKAVLQRRLPPISCAIAMPPIFWKWVWTL